MQLEEQPYRKHVHPLPSPKYFPNPPKFYTISTTGLIFAFLNHLPRLGQLLPTRTNNEPEALDTFPRPILRLSTHRRLRTIPPALTTLQHVSSVRPPTQSITTPNTLPTHSSKLPLPIIQTLAPAPSPSHNLHIHGSTHPHNRTPPATHPAARPTRPPLPHPPPRAPHCSGRNSARHRARRHARCAREKLGAWGVTARSLWWAAVLAGEESWGVGACAQKGGVW